MKSDISIPNPVLLAAENLAKRMGVSFILVQSNVLYNIE